MSRQRNPNDRINEALIQQAIADYGAKAYQVMATIGGEAFELVTALLVMVLVEHASGQQGLGTYAYLTACVYSVRYLSQYGVPRFLEREIAVPDQQPAQQSILIQRAFQATAITSLAGALVVLVTAGFDTTHTMVQEHIGAYIITAMILPIGNLNALKLAVLQGKGEHARVARLRMLRQSLILGGIFLLTRIPVPPSYLLVTFLLAESVLAVKVRGRLKLPGIHTAFKNLKRLPDTLKLGQAYLFTDNALNVLLNIDLLVLGWFVSSWDLGVYAEAAILVRFFMIVPLGIKPIVRRQYTIMTSQNQMEQLNARFRRHAALLFCFNAVAVVYVMRHFPAILDLFFETRGETLRSFEIFSIFVPGMLYYGTLLALEPAYEALGQAKSLKRLSMVMAAINFALTIYLVPAAGFWGAAAATMLTMLAHFVLFGKHLNIGGKTLLKPTMVIAGLGVYLIYELLKWLSWHPAADMALAPLLIGLMFYGCGLFDTHSNRQQAG